MSRICGTLCFLPALLFAAACDGPTSNGPLTQGGDEAQLTILNALVDGGRVQVLKLDGSGITLPLLGAARGLAIGGGAHTLDALDSSGKLTAHASFTVGSGGRRTAIMTGTGSGVLLAVSSDTTSLPPEGSCKIRIVHMAEGTSVLDSYLYRDTEAADSSTVLLRGISYGQGTNGGFPGYVVRIPWAYRIRVTAPGGTTALVESPVFHALPGEIWSIVLTRTTQGSLVLQPIKER